MFENYLRSFAYSLRQLATNLRFEGRKSIRRRRLYNAIVSLEALESRQMLTTLAWSSGTTLPSAAAGLVAEPAGSSLLVLGGGSSASYYVSANNPSWQATTSPASQPLDLARTSPAAGPLGNGYDIVYGGTVNGFATSAVIQYDPNAASAGTTNQTRTLRSMNEPRALLGGATDSSTFKSYAIGGVDNNGTPLNSVETYNPAANTWTYVAALPQTLYSESAVSDGAGHIYTFGGIGANGAITNTVYRYTIATNSWDQVASLEVGVRDSAAVLGSDGLIYVIGGTTANGATATVESFNSATNTWTATTALPQALSSETAVVDSLGRIEVLGGSDASGTPTASIYVSQQLAQPDLVPAFTSSPVTTAVLNGNYSYQALTTANPQASYSLTSAPAGMTINSSTGLISWIPTSVGSYNVTVLAANGDGQTPQSFAINVVLPTPAPPTGLTGTGVSTTAISLSWNASTDPYVTSYDVYRQYFAHSPKGSGGSFYYVLVASNITSTSVTISGTTNVSGTYFVTAVNSAGMQSARSIGASVAVMAPPILYTAITTSGADISSLNVNVGQTVQIILIQEFANPAPTFSVLTATNGPLSVDPSTGLVTYTPSAADIGYQPVTFSASNSAGTSLYTFYFNVVALTPTVTVTGGAFTYDGNPHAASATVVGADGITSISGNVAFTYNGSSTIPTAAGTYSVVATFTSNDPSYSNSVVDSTLTINPATPTITVISGPFGYDGNPHAVSANAIGVDGSTAVDGTFQITYNGDPTPPSAPGLYNVAVSFASNDRNYSSATVTSNLIINSPGTLVPELTLIDGSAPYDGNQHADSAIAVATDNVSGVAGSFLLTYMSVGSATASSSPPTQAGTYTVVANFISADPNYADATVTGTMTIIPVVPTLTVDPNPFTFDGTSHAALVTALGVDQVTPVSGSFAVTYDGLSTPPVNAGTYDVAVTFTSNDPNYLSTVTTSTITILPATPSVGLGDGGQWEFTYNGTPQSVVGIDGLTPINGTFSYTYYNEYGSNTQLFGPPLPGAPTDAGYYTFIETFTSLDPNYASGTFSWYLYIAPASPTLTLNSSPLTYNGSAQPAIVSAVGVDGVTAVAGSVTYATYNGSTTAPSAAGTYSTFVEWTSNDPNYYSTSLNGTYVINKATPTFSNLSSPVVNVGATTVTVSGHIAAGTLAPGGDDVAILINGITQPATVSANGIFSASVNIQGLTSGTYPISFVYLGDATRFNATASNGSSVLTVHSAPGILTSPISQTVVAGHSVTFSAAGSGNPAPTVQWQQSTNGGTSFSNITGATGVTYTINSPTASQNGYLYRAVFTNSVGSATTSAALLTVQSAPTITRNPANTTVNAGQTATLTAAATGNPAVSVQWQSSTDAGVTYSNIAGATSATLSLAGVTASQNGVKYRAIFTNAVGSVTTTSATLTVLFAPIIVTNPASQSIAVGSSVTFTAAATANPASTVQWQVSTDGGTTFTNIGGATRTSYTIAKTTASQNGYQYRAVFTNSRGSTTTLIAKLSVH